jgi:hypothetical protein
MSQFKFCCPHCGRRLQCDEQFSGREIQCPSCDVLIRIPPVPGKTAEYQPESGMTWATHLNARGTPAGAKLSIRRPGRQP